MNIIEGKGDWSKVKVTELEWLLFSLNEVTITGTRNFSKPSQFVYTEDAFGASWTYAEPTSGGSETGSPSSTPLTQKPWYVAISNMLSCMDLSASGASISAHFMGLQMPAGFVYSGYVFTATSILDNTIQLSEGFNWNDASQLGVGGVLIGTAFVASAPISVPVVFIGGVGLFIWEILEPQPEY